MNNPKPRKMGKIEEAHNGNLLCLWVLHGAVSTVRELLEKGANPNTFGATGRTPLHVLARYTQGTTLELNGEDWLKIELLIKYGADARLPDKQGKTPWDYLSPRNGDRLQKIVAQHEKEKMNQKLPHCEPLKNGSRPVSKPTL